MPMQLLLIWELKNHILLKEFEDMEGNILYEQKNTSEVVLNKV